MVLILEIVFNFNLNQKNMIMSEKKSENRNELDMSLVFHPIVYRLAKIESMIKAYIKIKIPADQMDEFTIMYEKIFEKTMQDIQNHLKELKNTLDK